MTFTSGSKLGPYEVPVPLGAGETGDVHRARDHRLDLQVAVKVLSDAVFQDPARLAHFDREPQAFPALNHWGSAAIHRLEEAEPGRFPLLELVEGCRSISGHDAVQKALPSSDQNRGAAASANVWTDEGS